MTTERVQICDPGSAADMNIQGARNRMPDTKAIPGLPSSSCKVE